MEANLDLYFALQQKNININTVVISDDEDSPAKHFADYFIYSKYDNEENLKKVYIVGR